MVARAAAALFAFVSVLGFLLFLGFHDSLSIAYFMVTILALIAFAAFPRKFLASMPIRTLLIVAAVAAIATTIPQMYRDLTLINGADHPAFVLRFVECLIFLVMGLEALAWPRLRLSV
jgi:hypothetical protein